MNKLYVILFGVLLSSSVTAAVDCNNSQIDNLDQEILRINALGLQDAAFKEMLQNSKEKIAKAKEDCAACATKSGDGWEFGESSGSKQCVCVGVKSTVNNNDKCEPCGSGKTVYDTSSGEQCLETFSRDEAAKNKAYCEKYGLTFTEASGENESTCTGELKANGRSIASSSSSNPTTDTKDEMSDEEKKAQAILDNPNASDEEREAACKSIDGKKWKKRKKECVDKKEREGLFGGDAPDIGFDDVTSFVGEAAENELVQGAAVGMLAGAGLGMAEKKFYEDKCDSVTNDEKCKTIAFKMKKYDDLEEYCTGNTADSQCVNEFFNNARPKFKDMFCESPTDANIKKKCKSIDKDAFYEEQCSEDKFSNLKTEDCFAMKDDNPKKFFEIYCDKENSDSAKSLEATPEFKAINGEQVCAPLKKQFGEEEEDDDEDSDDEDSDEDSDDEDSDDEDSDEDSDDDSDEFADSDDDEDESDEVADSDTGRAIASMDHSSASQDLSDFSDDKIMQLANMGHFNSDATLCEGSIYQVDSNCSMRKHANYLIKGKLGRVKIVGQKTLVCVYENHTGARFSAVIKKDCQL